MRPQSIGAAARSWTSLLDGVFLSEALRCVAIAEEAPGAYKDVGAVVAAAEHAGLARRVARLRPLICIKG